jgi:regulatory protein
LARVTEIRSERRGSKRREVHLDGEPWRSVSSEVIAAMSLCEGDEVDPGALCASLAELEPRVAKERALRLLSFKDRSHDGLVARLVEDGYPHDVSEAVTVDLERLGFVDDARYAEAFARTLVGIRNMGRSRAIRELVHAGIGEELALTAVDDALPADREIEAALAIARSAAARTGATLDKVAARLMRKGYRPGIALTAARTAMGERSHEDQDPPGDDAWETI